MSWWAAASIHVGDHGVRPIAAFPARPESTFVGVIRGPGCVSHWSGSITLSWRVRHRVSTKQKSALPLLNQEGVFSGLGNERDFTVLFLDYLDTNSVADILPSLGNFLILANR